jgi:hypothetical protein
MYNAKCIVLDGQANNEKTLAAVENLIAPHVQPMETPSSMMMGQTAAKHWLAANPDMPYRVAILDFGKFEVVEILRTTPF